MQHVRGIVGPLSIELASAGVTLIYGDNGVGKSSVCDAIEFGLRGVISRRTAGGRKERREVRNLSGRGTPTVDVNFANGTRIRRGDQRPKWDASGNSRSPASSTALSWTMAPVVLRRRVVEAFWELPPTARLDLFWDYLKPNGVEWRTVEEDQAIVAHVKAQEGLSRARRELFVIAPADTQWTHDAPPWNPPNKSASLPLIRKVVEAANRERGAKRRITPEQQTIIDEYGRALKEEEELRQGATSAMKKAPRDYARLTEPLNRATSKAAADFYAIFEFDWIKTITARIEDGSLDIQLVRHRGRSLSPPEILSEAQLDLLALLILIEVHIECAALGAAEFLVLDDVFQSVDTPVRRRALDHLTTRLRGWQLVVTVHDRLWLEIAGRCFTDANIRRQILELRHGGYGGTPSVFGGRVGPMRDLDGALAAGLSGPQIASAAGRALEHLADALSKSLKVKVVRKEREDYTIADLWPPVSSALAGTEWWNENLAKLDRAQFLRNKLGSHFAPWGDGISNLECEDAAALVRNAWTQMACGTCGRVPVEVKGNIMRTCGHNGPPGIAVPN